MTLTLEETMCHISQTISRLWLYWLKDQPVSSTTDPTLVPTSQPTSNQPVNLHTKKEREREFSPSRSQLRHATAEYIMGKGLASMPEISLVVCSINSLLIYIKRRLAFFFFSTFPNRSIPNVPESLPRHHRLRCKYSHSRSSHPWPSKHPTRCPKCVHHSCQLDGPRRLLLQRHWHDHVPSPKYAYWHFEPRKIQTKTREVSVLLCGSNQLDNTL